MVFRSATSREPARATAHPQVAAIAKADEQLAMYLHIKCGHQNQNMDYVRKTATLGKMKDLSKSIPDLKYPCPLCKIAAAPKIPRDKLTDPTELRKGDRIHADEIIMNTEPVRGFKTALILLEARSRKQWGFPTRSRSALVEHMKYFVRHLRHQGYRVLELQVDEDGSLA